MSKNNYLFSRRTFDMIECLDDDEKFAMLKAINEFVFLDKEPDFKGALKATWVGIKGNILDYWESYERKCENGKKGGRPRNTDTKNNTINPKSPEINSNNLEAERTVSVDETALTVSDDSYNSSTNTAVEIYNDSQYPGNVTFESPVEQVNDEDVPIDMQVCHIIYSLWKDHALIVHEKQEDDFYYGSFQEVWKYIKDYPFDFVYDRMKAYILDLGTDRAKIKKELTPDYLVKNYIFQNQLKQLHYN